MRWVCPMPAMPTSMQRWSQTLIDGAGNFRTSARRVRSRRATSPMPRWTACIPRQHRTRTCQSRIPRRSSFMVNARRSDSGKARSIGEYKDRDRRRHQRTARRPADRALWPADPSGPARRRTRRGQAMAQRLRGRGAVGGADPGQFTAGDGGHRDSRLLHPKGRHRDDDPGVRQPGRGRLRGRRELQCPARTQSAPGLRQWRWHHCAGAQLSRRTVGIILLPMLFERFPDMTLPDPAECAMAWLRLPRAAQPAGSPVTGPACGGAAHAGTLGSGDFRLRLVDQIKPGDHQQCHGARRQRQFVMHDEIAHLLITPNSGVMKVNADNLLAE